MSIQKMKDVIKDSEKRNPVKKFGTAKEINKATDKVLIQYAEAIKRLADR